MKNYQEAMDLAAQAADSAGFSDEVQEKYAESLNARLASLKATSQEFFYNMYNGQDTKNIVSFLTTILDLITKIQGGLGTAPLLGAVLGGALGRRNGGFFQQGLDNRFHWGWTTKNNTVYKNQSGLQNAVSVFNTSRDVDKAVEGLGEDAEGMAIALREVEKQGENAQATLSGTAQAAQNAGHAFQTVTLGSKAASIGMNALNMLGNAFISAGISIAISLIIKGIDALIHRSDRLIEKGKEAASTIKQLQSEYNTATKNVSDYGKVYQDLQAGVQLKDGKLTNVSLSTDEFEKFLAANNALAESFPELVSGFDSEGNAILNLGNSATTATEQLNMLLEAQQAYMRTQILNELPAQTKGIAEEVRKFRKEKINPAQKEFDVAQYMAGALADSYNITKLSDGSIRVEVPLLIDAEGFDDFKEQLENSGYDDFGYGERMIEGQQREVRILTKDFKDLTAAQTEFEQILKASGMSDLMVSTEQELSIYETELKTKWKSLIPSYTSLLSSSFIPKDFDTDADRMFSDLPDNIQQGLINAFSQIDIAQAWDDGVLTDETSIEEWMYKWLNTYTGENIESSLSDLFTLQTEKGTKSIQEYSNELETLVTQIAAITDQDKAQVKIDLGIDEDTAETTINNLYASLERHGTEFTEFEKQRLASELTFDDLTIAYDLINKGMSFDDLESFLAAIDGYSVRIDLNIAQGNIEKINTALSENTGATGLSSSTLSDLKNLYSDIYSNEAFDGAERFYAALEYTSEGVKLNTEALYELQDAQYEMVSTDYMRRLSFLRDQYRMASKQAAQLGDENAKAAGKSKAEWQAQADSIRSEIFSIEQQMAQLNALQSGYGKYQTATSTPNQGAVYDDMQSAIESTKDLYEKGLVGTDDFRSYVEMMFGTSATANIDDIVQAYENGLETINKYFTEDATGAQNFLEALDGLDDGLATVKRDANGEIVDFDVKDDVKAAEELGISLEAFQALLYKLRDYGWDVDIDDTPFMNKMEQMRQEAMLFSANVEQIVSELNKKEFKLNYDATTTAEFDDQISEVQKALQAMYEEDGSLKVEYNKADADLLLDTLVALQHEKSLLNQPAFMTVDTSQFTGKYKEAMDALQAYQSLQDQLAEAQLVADITGDTTEVSAIQDQLDDVKKTLDDLNNEGWLVQIGFTDTHGNKIEDIDRFFSTGSTNVDRWLQNNPTVQADQKLLQSNPQLASYLGENTSDILIDYNDDDSFKDILKHREEIEQDITTTVEYKESKEKTKGAWGRLAEKTKQKFSTKTKEEHEVSTTERKQTILGTSGNGTKEVEEYNEALEKTPSKIKTDIQVSTNGGESKIGAIGTALSKLPKNTEIKVSVVASGLQTIINKLNEIKRKKAELGGGGVNGTAHVLGTAYANGTAFAHGDWGVKRGQTALVGELGEEVIVRDGQYFTVGTFGAEFVKLRKDDIIFNHKQTEELLKHGYVTSSGGRGKALANGTANKSGNAYSSGTGRFYGGAKAASLQSKSKANTSADRVASAVNSAAKATEDFLDSLSNYFDYVAIKLDRVNQDTEKAIDAIEVAAGLTAKQAANSKAILATGVEMDINRQAYNRYMQHANMIARETGLSKSIQTGVQNGRIDITKYDETTKKAIDEYKQWVDAANDSLKTISELKKQERELALERLQIITDYYDSIINVKNTVKDLNQSKIDLKNAIGESAISGAGVSKPAASTVAGILKDSITQQQAVTSNLIKERDNYKAELDDLVKRGYLKTNSNDYREAQSKLNEFAKEINESKTAVADFQKQLKELQYTKLSNKIDAFARIVDRWKNIAETNEAMGLDNPREVYAGQMNANKSQIYYLYQQRNMRLEEMKNWEVDSERYQEAAKQVAEWDDQIYKLIQDNEELEDTLRELNWTPYKKAQESLQKVNEELSDIRTLLDDDGYINKNGVLTTSGAASVALLAEMMGNAKQQIANYTTALQKLEEEYQNGLITGKQFEEEQLEIIDSIREAATSIEDYKDILIDLYKKQLEAETDAMQKVIDKRKDALAARKEYADYDKDIRNSQKQVNILRAQYEALNGVTTAEGLAQRKRLAAQLAEAEEALQEKRDEHKYTIEIQGLESISDDLDETLEDTLDAIATNAAKQEEIVQTMLTNVVSMYKAAYSEIQQLLKNTGIILTDQAGNQIGLLQSLSGTKSVFNRATEAQSITNTRPDSTIAKMPTNDITYNNYEKQIGGSTSVNTIMESLGKGQTILVSKITPSAKTININKGQTKKLSVTVSPAGATNKNLIYSSTNTKAVTVDSKGNVKGVGIGGSMIEITAADGGGASTKIKVVSHDPNKTNTSTTSAKGYASGTTDATAGLHKINEIGDELVFRYAGNDYTVLSKGDQVMKANLSNRIFDMAKNPSKFIAQHMPNITATSGAKLVQINYDNMINIEGNATPETVVQLQDLVPELTNQITKNLVQEYRKLN